MMAVYCNELNTRVLLDLQSVEGICGADGRMNLTYRCICGQRGRMLIGRARGETTTGHVLD